jgi:enoyl-[acyl-carrier protein] reductase I
MSEDNPGEAAGSGSLGTGLLAGKNLLITGVITEASMAFHTARLAQQQGATVVLTGYGRMSLVQRIAQRLPEPAPVVELDVTNTEHLDSLADRVRPHADRIDGVLHAIAFAPGTALGGVFLQTPWEDVATALHASAYSLKALAVAIAPLMSSGGSIVGLDFDARQAWPAYDWMGVAKAALESTSRYLARDLGPSGIRVNLVSAGPIRTIAAKSIPGFAALENAWTDRAPLGWDTSDPTPVARACVALLSDLFPATTGSMVMVDGGFSALGFSAKEIAD